MAAKLVELVREAAARARLVARGYPSGCSAEALPWAVIKRFDEDVRGHVERDPRIEDGRDQVLIAAVNLAEAAPDDEAEAPERERLVKAINDLEWVTLSRGIVNRAAAASGHGAAGDRLRDAG
ncbi:hypothetical protein SAMN02799631_03083 [Methylobacterium sp. 174MFSha1.1]|uniref:hypothetical protein n=1 Tax=Methylobacterium sp. 174MFSha1.1 TaxID=1502749 RepID=UPI0008E98F1E|nr:hypothetical protein [Methylobacterium sp. 174MFSha1.1]SFU90843.1 hypothetical protein SAMN02799631_03083 [Methylobacterium sp. 174MFSha1.1]